MHLHQALTQFDRLAPGAMIFLAADAAIMVGDIIGVTQSSDAVARLRVTHLTQVAHDASDASGAVITVFEDGRDARWALALTDHPLSQAPVLIVQMNQSFVEGGSSQNAVSG